MPAKIWADYERLTAADLNTYVSQQVVAVFATPAARDLGIPAPLEGQAAYVTSLKAITIYVGSSWKLAALAGGCGATLEASSNQSIPNSTPTKILVPTVIDDSHGFALGSSELTVPVGLGGLYELLGALYWASQTTVVGFRNLEIHVGAATLVRAIQSQGTASVAAIMTASGIVRLADGAVVSLYGSHTHGSAINSTSDTFAPRLSIRRVGD
jgi:hypothetical protein